MIPSGLCPGSLKEISDINLVVTLHFAHLHSQFGVPCRRTAELAAHFIWANQDSCEDNQVSQIPHAFQIWCLTLPTSFIAMIVHCGAEPFGAVQLGNSSQFPQGSPERGSCRAAFLIPFVVPSRFQKIAIPTWMLWRLPFRAGRRSTVAAADSRCSALGLEFRS